MQWKRDCSLHESMLIMFAPASTLTHTHNASDECTTAILHSPTRPTWCVNKSSTTAKLHTWPEDFHGKMKSVPGTPGKTSLRELLSKYRYTYGTVSRESEMPSTKFARKMPRNWFFRQTSRQWHCRDYCTRRFNGIFFAPFFDKLSYQDKW